MKYTSNNFHLHYIPQYRLLIQSDFLEDTLLVLDESNEIQALYSYPSNNPDTEAAKLLGLPFQDVTISLPLQSLVFVPTEVYNSRDIEHYQDFMIDENKTRTQTFHIEQLGITALYQYDLLLRNRWATLFPAARLLSDSQVMLSSLATDLPAQGTILGLHVKDKQVELFVFSAGTLQLYNIFDIETQDDLQYFILHVCNTLDIAARFDKVILSGIDSTHNFAHVAGQYTDVAEFFTPKTTVHTADETVEAKISSFNLLADYPTCVS